jgi:hypothetical protein
MGGENGFDFGYPSDPRGIFMSAQMGKRCQDKNSAYCDGEQEFAASDDAEHAGQDRGVDGVNRSQGRGANSLTACMKFRERSLNLHHNLAYSCGGRCLERRM